jgi:hypothetical protein
MHNIRKFPTRKTRFEDDAHACAQEINKTMDRLARRYGAMQASAGLTTIAGVMLCRFRHHHPRKTLYRTLWHLLRAAFATAE